jgi:hypothetical protein
MLALRPASRPASAAALEPDPQESQRRAHPRPPARPALRSPPVACQRRPGKRASDDRGFEEPGPGGGGGGRPCGHGQGPLPLPRAAPGADARHGPCRSLLINARLSDPALGHPRLGSRCARPLQNRRLCKPGPGSEGGVRAALTSETKSRALCRVALSWSAEQGGLVGSHPPDSKVGTLAAPPHTTPSRRQRAAGLVRSAVTSLRTAALRAAEFAADDGAESPPPAPRPRRPSGRGGPPCAAAAVPPAEQSHVVVAPPRPSEAIAVLSTVKAARAARGHRGFAAATALTALPRGDGECVRARGRSGGLLGRALSPSRADRKAAKERSPRAFPL